MSEKRTTDTEEQPNKPRRWRLTKRQALWAIGLGLALSASIVVAVRVAMGMGNRFGYVPLVLVLLFILIRLGYRYEWTGFKETSHPKDEKSEIQPRKTLWDWMQLLFVPTMLAILAGGLTWWQTSSERARQVEEAARQEALRAQNTAVQAYLDQMTTLMLQMNLRDSTVDSEVRTLAQARTSVVLGAVDPENQRTLLQFLSDARLIQQVDENRLPIISLDHVGLSGSDLRNIALSGSNLSEADLSDANLSGANLSEADLSDTNLSSADLSGANLSAVDLSGDDLSHADLRFADLSRADLTRANLSHAGLRFANLSEANLLGADLSNADLSRADLSGATMPNDPGIRSFGNLSLAHKEGRISYEQTPPVGGPHADKWQNCGFYSKPVRNENAVHSLEHGVVWITYRPDLPQDQVGKLQDLAHSQTYILISPYPDLPSPVVASAWGKQMKLERADDPDLARFVQAYREGPQTPEPGGACTNGVGTPE